MSESENNKKEALKKKTNWARDIVEAIIVFVLIMFLTVSNLLSPFDYIIKDKLYQIPRGVNSNIKIIAIDDRTLDELGPIGTWSRSTYADLINVLNSNDEAKPAVIAFDILFSGHVDDGDYAFAEAAKQSGNVVVDSHFLYGTKPEYDADGLISYQVESITNPYEELDQVVKVGFSNISQDSDKIVRRLKAKEIYDGEEYDMFPKVLYDVYCEKTNKPTIDIPTDKYGRTLINYSGKPGDYEAISLVDVLDGKIDSRAFKDSIILVGAYASGMQDQFNVPNGNSSQMFGVEIHANIVQSFIQSRFSIPGNPYLFGFILGIVGAALHILFKRTKVYFAAIGLVVSIGIELYFGTFLNDRGTNIGLINFPVVMVISFIYCLAIGYILEQHRKRQVLNAFKKYVAPQVVDEISKSGKFKVELVGEERDIAALFVDIRGFTTMSEALTPKEVVAILNEYLALTTKAVFDNSGTLDKFVGDCTMAVWNSPFDQDDYEYKAVCAALDIVNGGKILAKELEEKYGRSVGFGVGVHCGKAVVGNIGCDFRMDFTAIGDTVNTAARLEANASAGQVLISEDLYERLKGRIEATILENPPKLKGKSNTFNIYQVDGLVK